MLRREPAKRRWASPVSYILGVAVVQGIPAASRGRSSLSLLQDTFCHTVQEQLCPGYAKVMRWCCGQSDGRNGRNETCDAYMGQREMCGGHSNMQHVMDSCCVFEWSCTGGWCGMREEKGDHIHIGTASPSVPFESSLPNASAKVEPLPARRRWGDRAPTAKPDSVLQQKNVAQADDGIEVVVPDAGPGVPASSETRGYQQRPQGRAPNGENGLPMQWASDAGEWVQSSGTVTRVQSSTAKQRLAEETSDEALIPTNTYADEMKQKDAGKDDQSDWASAPHQSSVHKQPTGPAPNGENGVPMQWAAEVGGWVQSPRTVKQRRAASDGSAKYEAAQDVKVASAGAVGKIKGQQADSGGIVTDADGVVIGPDWSDAVVVTDGTEDGIVSGNAAAAAAAIAAAPKFDIDAQEESSRKKEVSDPTVATENCVSLQASVNNYWCSTVCSNGACPERLCKCGTDGKEALAAQAADEAKPSATPDMQSPDSATPDLQCVSISPIVTVDWCVNTCSHGRCPPKFCKCGAAAQEVRAESTATATAPAAAIEALPVVKDKEMECTALSISVNSDWCRTTCSAGGACPKALCACVAADSGQIAFPAPGEQTPIHV